MITIMTLTACSAVAVTTSQKAAAAPLVGGTMTGTGLGVATAFFTPAGQTYIFATDSSGAVWFRTLWGNGVWQSIGGTSTLSSAVAGANALYPNLGLDVFTRGADGSLMYKSYQNGWSSWQSLGGKLAAGTGPAVCSWSAGRLDVFVTGTDGILYHKWYANGSWSGWQSLGGKLTSSPTAAVPTDTKQIDVFVRATDSALWWKQWNGNAWIGWKSLGGRLAPYTGPAVNFFSYRLLYKA